jgi:hypothetical protein
LAGGFLHENGVPLLGIVMIATTTGALSFVGGQPVQQGLFIAYVAATAPPAD